MGNKDIPCRTFPLLPLHDDDALGREERGPAPFGWGTGKCGMDLSWGSFWLVKTVAAVGGLTSALLLVSLIRYLLSIPFLPRLIANHEHNRSPTQRPTTLSSHAQRPCPNTLRSRPSSRSLLSGGLFSLLLKSTLEVSSALGCLWWYCVFGMHREFWD